MARIIRVLELGSQWRLPVEVPAGLPALWAWGEGALLKGAVFGARPIWMADMAGKTVLPWEAFLALSLDWPEKATPFQQSVWQVVQAVPAGQVRTYGWVARQLDRPGSVRAVGQALKRNPFAWRVPCHRIIRADGHLGGFAWGVDIKRQLLQWEEREVGGR